MASRAEKTLPAVGDFLLRHRWLYVVPLVLPASKVFAAYCTIRERYRRRLRGAPHLHHQRVAAIQAEIRTWRDSGARGLLCTSRPVWQSMAMSSHESYKNHNHPVRVELYDILDVDLERRIIRVEPGVTMGQITARLSPLGWTLPVVPELEDLTVGGLILGYGVETSSHKYGIFADLVDSYEVLLGTGEVVRASRESHADLFHALPWSRGTLGFLTAVELRIIPAKPWVRLEYHPVQGLDEACALFTKFACADNPPEFVEGFLYSVDTAVIVTGEFTDRSDADLVNRVGRWYKPWYYEHVRSHLRIGPRIEYVPLREYYHRHSRSIFWVSELLVPFGNHPLFRYLLGWLMPPKTSFLKVTETPRLKELYLGQTVVQDAVLPIRHLQAAVEMFHKVFDVYPIWLAPMKMSRTEPPGMAGPAPGTPGGQEMFVDVGAFFSIPGAVRRGEPWDHRQAHRRLEAWLRDHGGYQAPYGLSEMTDEEFRQMFDCTLYDQVRHTCGAEGTFVDILQKLKRF